MYWLQRRRKEAGRGQQVTTPGPDRPRWLEARVEGEVPKSENLVLEMGGGIRMLVGNRTQAALAGGLLRAMGLGRGFCVFREACGYSWRWRRATYGKGLRDFRRWWAAF